MCFLISAAYYKSSQCDRDFEMDITGCAMNNDEEILNWPSEAISNYMKYGDPRYPVPENGTGYKSHNATVVQWMRIHLKTYSISRDLQSIDSGFGSNFWDRDRTK